MKKISPISIDLGAKNTGVFFAHYTEGASLEDIKKDGKVYTLEKDAHTLLMANRTTKRHARRAIDRRKMAKRLFRLVWEQHLNLKWDNSVQQTIGFLMNRRGFSFLTETFDPEILNQFPQKAYELLPAEAKNILNDKHHLYECLQTATQQGIIDELHQALSKKSKEIKSKLLVISRIEKLQEYCKKRKEDNKFELTEDKKNLSNLSQWILKEWKDKGIKGISNLQPENPKKNTVDVVAFLNQASPTTLETILKSIPDVEEEKEKLEKELEKDPLNFGTKKFKTTSLENITDENITDENKKIKTHLHHLVFAVGSIDQELKTGNRYRSLYFKEIEEVLGTTDKHKENYLKTFCEKLHNNNFAPLTPETLKNLIAHISNLELKPLRKYFNGIKHKNGDSWDELRIANIFKHWIHKEWRVDKNDKNKAQGKPQDYMELKQQWGKFANNNPKKVIDFWLKHNPDYTIPPYQDNNNRRPPKCQSFILNVNYLNSRYKNWQQWVKKDLKNIDGVKDYKEKLQRLESGKGKLYFTVESVGNKKESATRNDAHLQARVLQFIFDRIKASDSLKLNEIYSHTKKIRQNFSGDEKNQKDNEAKLENAIDESKLPPSLKSEPDYNNKSLFTPGSFLHLICKYYKLRQRAKEGRIFIHPKYKYSKERGHENTGHFNDTDHLLSYCNHKPRQKRHQLFFDVAGLIQITPEKLKQKLQKYVKSIVPNTEDEPSLDELVLQWLNLNKGLASACAAAAKLQKERRGELKTDINRIYGLLYHNDLYSFTDISDDKQSNRKNILDALDKSKIENEKYIYDLSEKAKEKWKNLITGLYDDNDDIDDIEKEKQRLQKNPVAAIFQLAQLNNIAFQDRSGNASTCPVCSADNAERMASDKNDTDHSKAQRLPAIKTRIIDGAVMKMARVLAKAIANDKWAVIEKELQNGTAVSIPIITESNRFEFEPNLREIKNKAKDTEKANEAEEKLRNNISKDEKEKEKRIKKSSNNICAYSGASINNGKLDLDHIIPRQSRWGTLNDEANLIYVTQQANRKKSNQLYTLSNLDRNYKLKQFNTDNNQEIEAWIIEQIGDGSTNFFKFDRYNSFINLSPNEQKAFRHALFLHGTAIQKQVINAINNRTRALVNGTQRYFAETLANELHKLAKVQKLEAKLYFDYFGVEAWSSNKGTGIKQLREKYETADETLKTFAKNSKQPIYSHLIDAKMAFIICADAHRHKGSLKLNIPDNLHPEPYDREGEINNKNFFDYIKIPDTEMKKGDLKAVSNDDKISQCESNNSNKKLPTVISRAVFKDNALGEKYKPIVKFNNQYYLGYPQRTKNGQYDVETFCSLINNVKIIEKIIQEQHYYSLAVHNKAISIYCIKTVNKKYRQINEDAHYFFSNIPLKTDNAEDSSRIKMIDWIMNNCRYYVQKESVEFAPSVINNKANKKYPLYLQWKKFDEKWRKWIGNDYKVKQKGKKTTYDLTPQDASEKWEEFCKEYFLKSSSQLSAHYNKRGVYSMNSTTSPPGTVFRIKRHGQLTYQAYALDMNIVSKTRSNYLIKHSKNLTIASKTPSKDINMGIATDEVFDLKDYSLKNNTLFFKEEFLQKLPVEHAEQIKNVAVTIINKTTIEINNLPTDLFFSLLNDPNSPPDLSKESVIIGTQKTNIKKEKLSAMIKPTCRDGSITQISYNNHLVKFCIPFKSDTIKKYYEDISETPSH